jgi:uncharacterized protein
MILYTIPVSDGTDQSPGESKYIIYRPLAGLAFVGNRAMADLAQTCARQGVPEGLSEDILEFLRASSFLAPDPPAPPLMPAAYSPTTAVLLLTNQCQLRCTYCYAAAGEFPPEMLSFELARAVIDHACENAMAQKLPGFEVTFHGGGEPTLAWKLIQDCVAYARGKPLPAKITLTSNGIWSSGRCAWLLDHLDGLSLSMDGSPQTQDRHRPYASGKGSSAQVLRVIAEMDRRKFPYGIRMTAAAPWDDFPGDVRYLCENTACQSFQVEPAFNTARGGHGHASLQEAMAFAQAFMEAYDIAVQAGRLLHYSGARLGLVTRSFCTAPYQALIVNPGGNLVTCYEIASQAHELAELSRIGQVNDGRIQVDQAARDHLHGLIAERQAACQDCFAYWTCAGDCYTRAFAPGEDGHRTHGVRCALNRYLLEKLLLRGIAAGDGAWRAANQRMVSAPAGITI